jgi:hypothetical protein
MPEVAEDLGQLETPPLKQEEGEEDEQLQGSIDKNKLTKTELFQIEEGKTSISKLVQEREQHKQAAKAEIKDIKNLSKQEDVVDMQEFQRIKQECEKFEQEIEKTESPEKMKELLKKIKELPQKLEDEKHDKAKQDKQNTKKLDINDKGLKAAQARFNSICDKNIHLIGKRELPGFKKWFTQELSKNPTMAFAKETIEKLEGKKFDRQGLAPRKQLYNELTAKFTKYGLSAPHKSSTYVQREGLSERTALLEKAKDAETETNKVNDKFWSPKAKKQVMQDVLLTEVPGQKADEKGNLIKKLISEKIEDIKKINKIESQGFIYMKNTMSVGGNTVRKMSDASITEFLKGVTNEGDLKKRMAYITGFGKYQNGIIEAVENEASLAGPKLRSSVKKDHGVTKSLEEIYEGKPEELKMALQSFGKLNFMQKIDALKEHERLVENSDSKEELESKLTILSAHAAIDEAATKKYLSKTTQAKWKKWFDSDKALKDPKTGEKTGLEALKANHKILTSHKASAEYKNIIAFKIKRDRFQNELKEFEQENPKLPKKEITKWQDLYDKSGWTERKKVYKNFIKEKERMDSERKKQQELEAKTGIDQKDKTKEKSELSKEEVLRSARELMDNNQAGEALSKLADYNKENPDDPKIIFWIGVVASFLAKFGSGKKMEETRTKQIEEKMEKIARSDEELKDEIEEANLKTINIKEAKISEERDAKKKSGQDRAEKESVARTQDGSLEQEFTKDLYEQTDDEHILDESGTGEHMTEVKFQDAKMTDTDRQALKETTREKQSRIIEKKGFTHVNLKDKSGRKISATEAETENKKKLEDLQDKLEEKTIEKIAKLEGKPSTPASLAVFDLNDKMAAARKSREIVDRESKSHERLKK